MLLYNNRVKVFLTSLLVTSTLSASIPKSTYPRIGFPGGLWSNLTLAATEDRRLFLSQDCLVPNSNINVRYELRPQVIAAPRMHQMIIGAMTYTYNKLIEDGPPRDRPLESDELPFEYDGIGSSKWYYIDVEQTPPGILTWEKLLVIFEGLLLCTFRRRQYHAVHFEVFEYTGSGDDEIRIGLGDFGTKVQAAVQ